ncbi:MAG: NAD(P)-dependent oxidoreductase [Anaerolineales bacterium]|nr:NAD(P)-dependent oxidoreductase [Anaerolineales bacterium]
MTKTVLITGASGEVGRWALAALLELPEAVQVRVLSLDNRSEQRFFKAYQGRIEMVWGDLRDPQAVTRAVDGVQAVIHTAAIIPPLADTRPDLAWEVNVTGTQNLINALRVQPRAVPLVYTSSISVYGDRVANPVIRVGDPLQPSLGDEYARTKVEAEHLVRSSGLPYTILRLCGVLTSKLKIQPLMFHMPLDTSLEWIRPADAGLALVKALDFDAVWGRTFNLGGGPACQITARAFLQTMLPIFGLRGDLLPEQAFATDNFHSGFYADSDALNAVLDFQRGDLAGYFAEMRRNVHPLSRALVRLLPSALVRFYLLRMSEPLQAIRQDNQDLIRRFYGSRQAFESLLASTTRRPLPDSGLPRR